MENEEESEGAFVEGTANADLLDAHSHLIMPGAMIPNKLASSKMRKLKS